MQSNVCQPAVNMLCASEESLSTVPVPETVSVSTIVTMNESHVSGGSILTLPVSGDIDVIEGVCANKQLLQVRKNLDRFWRQKKVYKYVLYKYFLQFCLKFSFGTEEAHKG